MELSGDSFFKRVFDGFEQLAKTEKRFQVINAESERDIIHQEVVKRVEELFK